jgi:hypothetical protein
MTGTSASRMRKRIWQQGVELVARLRINSDFSLDCAKTFQTSFS